MADRFHRRTRSTESPDSQSRALGTSYRSRYGEQTIASIAEESIQRDIDEQEEAEEEEEAVAADDETDHEVSNHVRNPSHDLLLGPHAMVGSHRRPSVMAAGPRPFLGAHLPEAIIPLEQEVDAAIEEERSLLRDNNLIAPKHPRKRKDSQSSVASRTSRSIRHRLSVSVFSIPRKGDGVDEEAASAAGNAQDEDAIEPSETTALLPNASADPSAPYGGEDDPANIDKKWEEAVVAGQIETTWQREAKTLVKYSLPLVFTFLMQTSITLTSVFTVGHIGEIELGAVSLGSMTANITGNAVYYGLTTSLDTLCAQAYGSGKKQLVGLQLQRMVLFLWTCTIPIAILWLSATQILMVLVPEQQIAESAGLYLKVIVLGAPAFALFESSKRYVQAQGRFEANMYVLLIAAPLNVLLHWLFVWHFKWGFIGCPIAVVITQNLMPILLFLYVRLFIGLECWPGFSRRALHNWWPMIRLAIPGLVMVMAEMLAFEILVLASARISATHLAAQTVLQSLSVIAYQVPYPISIATSTRVANLIGASLPEAAKKTARVSLIIGAVIGVLNLGLLGGLRNFFPRLFTNEPKVIKLAAQTLPVNAAFQLTDALAAQLNGILRGLGKQEFGGYVSLLVYYAIGIPVSFSTAFGLHWDLYGLWAGPAVSLFVQACVTGVYIYRTSWQKASEEAAKRNAAD